MSGRAKFVHWLVSPFDDIPSEPMFNVVENDKGLPNGSTVCGSTAMAVYGISIPLFPDLKTWKQLTEKKKRCFRCWGTLRGTMADYVRHIEMVHHEARINRANEAALRQGNYKRHIPFAAALIVFLGSLLFAGRAHAWEFTRNPDRFMSVGVNVSKLDVGGKRFEVDQPSDPLTRVNSGPENRNESVYGADLRLPVSDSVTVGLFYDYIDGSNTFDREASGKSIFRQSLDYTGNHYGMSVRFYLNK